MKLSHSYQNQISEAIVAALLQTPEYQQAKHLALYNAHQGEIDVTALWQQALVEGKHCYFPVILPQKTLSFLPCTLETPQFPNGFGILEPQVNHHLALNPEQLDLILVPLVAFDEQGQRIGQGQGYYDKTLMKLQHPKTFGLAYEFQKEPCLMADPWDIVLTAIVTEKTIYRH